MNAVVHVEVFCEEFSHVEPYRKISEEEFEGTAFGVDGSVFQHKFPGRLFLTNFHVVDNAKDKKVRISTAWMGRGKLTGRVVHVVPYLDVAVISVCPEDTHDRYSGDVAAALERIETLPLDPRPLKSKSQKVYTVGYPMGLELHKSVGTVAGRGTEENDLVQFNLSLNSGNSGGPIILNNKVVAIASCTLEDSEGIAFGVPATSVLAYYEKWTNGSFGKFPAWGFKTMPLTDAYAREYSYQGTGVVVYSVAPEVNAVKVGDILLGIDAPGVSVDLDNFGLFHDPTRDPMISINNSEFIMKLTPKQTSLRIWRKGFKCVQHSPQPITLSVQQCWREWNPPKFVVFGSIVFQKINESVLEEVPASKSIPIIHQLQQSNYRKEIVCVSYLHPNGYVTSLSVLDEFDVVEKVGRVTVRSFAHFCETLEDVARRWKQGSQKRVCLTTDKKVWLSLDKLAQDEAMMNEDPAVPPLMLVKKRKR